MDDVRGVPAFVWAARSAASTHPLSSLPSEQAARRHLETHAAEYGLDETALATASVVQVHDLGRGPIVVVFRQRPMGVEVFRSDMKVMMDRGHDLVAIGGALHSAAVPQPKGANFRRSERDAIAAAFKDLHGMDLPSSLFVAAPSTGHGYALYDLPQSASADALRFTAPARVKRVFYPLGDALVPAHFVELATQSRSITTAYAFVIAANDGRLLYRENLTHRDAFHYRVWADDDGHPNDGPASDYTPHPTGVPDQSFPDYAAPKLVSMDGFNAKHDPWLAADATETKGNNVDAYTDDDAPDGFSTNDLRAAITAPGFFDHSIDFAVAPEANDEQKMGAVTQLFYTTNWLANWWYDSGFDEAAGNAQQDNYGRGGADGDPLHAEAQDGAPNQRDNSNMSVQYDGASPRMQMFVWSGKTQVSLSVQSQDPSANGLFQSTGATYGPENYAVTADVVLVDDGTGSVTDACEDIQNDLTGKIALLDRGTCTFKSKVIRAQAKGAIGVILADNKPNEPPPLLQDNDPQMEVQIPARSISQADGETLKAVLAHDTVAATLSRNKGLDRDGTLDNTIVAHEWGHYIHLRQVACGSAQCGAQSEGWGDFFALHLVVKEGDDLSKTYAMAQYATRGISDDAGYFGIRRYPYSTDKTKSPLTFKHITSGAALPAGVPSAPTGGDNAEVHNAGEIWASMLFDAYAGLIARTQLPNAPYGFEEARRRMGDYVEGGLKLAPKNPTYLEQRDAILAAAAATDPDDAEAIAQGFAARGAGTCAVSPARDSDTFTGVVESFEVKANVAIVSATIDDGVASCDGDGHLDAGETGTLTVTAMNTGPIAVSDATATVTAKLAGVTFPQGNKLSFGSVAPHSTAAATITVRLPTDLVDPTRLDLEIASSTAGCSNATLAASPLVNFDTAPMASATDSIDEPDTAWKAKGTLSGKIWSRVDPTGTNTVWSGVDYPSPSDTSLVSPTLDVSTTEELVVTFKHRHQFEASNGTFFDGGVVELSLDDGANWKDVSTYTKPGYGGTIGDMSGGAKNALKGREGFVGTNPSWPASDEVTMSLGMAAAGKQARIRFRIATDDAAGGFGWELDDIGFQGITNKPFTAIVNDAAQCGPIANAGPDLTAHPGEHVVLDGTTSLGDSAFPPSYAWKQTAGPEVTLLDASGPSASFTAPDVASATRLTFQLIVSDTIGTGVDTVDVLVTPLDTASDVSGGGGCAFPRRAPGSTSSLFALGGIALLARRSRRTKRN